MTDLIAKTTRTYARDLAERVIATFAVTALGVAVAAGPADLLNVSLWRGAAVAGLAAAGSLVKGALARYVGEPNSASVASRV